MAYTKRSLVCGVGFNDADYKTNKTGMVDGVRKIIWRCPYSVKWYAMIHRCYNSDIKRKRPNYNNCSVCDEWLIFSNFKRWMEQQDWEGKHLDKDLLVDGNKTYSPETCIFIDHKTNAFLNDHGSARGVWPIGVSFHKSKGKFHASCSNFLTKKTDSIGHFSCSSDAHNAWRKRKHELACILAGMQSDFRAAEALMVRYK